MVQDLARARALLDREDAEVAIARVALDRAVRALPETEQLDRALASRDQHQAAVGILDDLVRKAAVEGFRATGDKHPCPGVGIREVSVSSYDVNRAKSYAIEHIPNALELKPKKFVEVAKALGLDWVTFEKVPEATISQDLSEYLDVEPGDTQGRG